MAVIKFVVPKEGSDLWVDTIVVLKNSEHKDAAMKFINFILDTKNHAWAAENILYKVPNKAAMESLDKALFEQYPNMAMTPASLASIRVQPNRIQLPTKLSLTARKIA